MVAMGQAYVLWKSPVRALAERRIPPVEPVSRIVSGTRSTGP